MNMKYPLLASVLLLANASLFGFVTKTTTTTTTGPAVDKSERPKAGSKETEKKEVPKKEAPKKAEKKDDDKWPVKRS